MRFHNKEKVWLMPHTPFNDFKIINYSIRKSNILIYSALITQIFIIFFVK